MNAKFLQLFNKAKEALTQLYHKELTEQAIKKQQMEQVKIIREQKLAEERLERDAERAAILQAEADRKEQAHFKIQARIEQLPTAEVNALKNQKQFSNPFQMQFFQTYIEDILKLNENSFASVYTDDRITIVKIDKTLLQDINAFMYSVLTGYDQNANHSEFTSNLLYHADKVVIMTPGYFNSIEEELKLKESEAYYQETNFGTLNVRDVSPDVKKRLKGKYFNYINLIPTIDLTRYQIGQTESEHIQLSQEHCFLYSLKMSGRYTEEQLNEIKIQLLQSQELFSATSIPKINTYFPINISYYKPCGKATIDKLNSNLTGVPIELALFKEHYFINEHVNVTPQYVKNYEQYHDNPKFILNLRQVKTAGANTSFAKSTDHKTTSLDIIRCMFDYNYFKEITEVNQFNFEKLLDTQIVPANSTENCQIELKKVIPNSFCTVIFARFTAFTNEGDFDESGYLKYTPHKEFMLCFQDGDQEIDGRNIYCLINYIRNKYWNATLPQKILVLFHKFADYDSQFVLNANLPIINKLFTDDGKCLSLTIKVKTKTSSVHIQFGDSYKFIQTKIAKMPEMFSLQGPQLDLLKKQIFPLDYYTKKLYIDNIGNIEDAAQFLGLKQEFIAALTAANAMIDEETFDMYKFCLFYCRQDVRILAQSMNKFREIILKNFDTDIYDYMSLSSASADYFKKQGCFKGVFQVSGSLNTYLHKFISGGVCMLANNEKSIVNQPVQYLDFNALYSAVQAVIPYPAGEPHKLTPDEIKYYNEKSNLMKITIDKDSTDQNLLFLDVKLSFGSDFKPLRFPVLSQVVNGVRHNINDLNIDEVFHYPLFDLQNAVEFQNYDYEIVGGLCFTKRQYKINQAMKNAYDVRMYYKSMNSPVQEVIKTFTNSNWGKTIQKSYPYTHELIDRKDLDKFAAEHFNLIAANGIHIIGDKALIKMNKETDKTYGYPHVGSLILSYARRMLFQVTTLAEENGILGHYIDTDSLFVNQQDVEKLDKLYFEKYGRYLIGSGLGQMKFDFKSELGKVVCAKNSIFLKKKMYCNELLLEAAKTDFRTILVGVTPAAITEKCENLKITPFELYTRLYNHETIKMNMLAGGRPCFRKNEHYATVCQQTFDKEIQI